MVHQVNYGADEAKTPCKKIQKAHSYLAQHKPLDTGDSKKAYDSKYQYILRAFSFTGISHIKILLLIFSQIGSSLLYEAQFLRRYP